MEAKFQSTVTPHKGGGVDINLVCPDCGKPIVTSTEYGMFCEDRCGEAEAKIAVKQMKKMIKGFNKLFESKRRTQIGEVL